ncbi:MAG TPA: type VI secretion system tip protein TssI/VgrG [Acetobacteraceae bacterium]|nr:type VI secretion system tip protein TssI/VgrG [Acetobacteraceae bacterium]
MSESAASTAQAPQLFLSLTVPAKGGQMTPISFCADEVISKPFLVTIEAVSNQANLDPTIFLYQPVCLTLTETGGPTRYFNGVVRRFVARDAQPARGWAYAMEVVPRLWFMSQTVDSRIFENQSSKQIITTLLQEALVADVQWQMYSTPVMHDYTTQMNETDLDFISRLMQQEGWFYYFQQSQSAHTLIITDDNRAFGTIQKPQVSLGTSLNLHLLQAWSPFQATTYGETSLKDYDPTVPNELLEATQKTTDSVAGAMKRDFFRWPALTYVTNLVDDRTRIIMAAAEANASLIAGMGQHSGFTPGSKFVLTNDPYSGGASQEYVIRSVIHQGSGSPNVSGGYAPTYGNSFTCFPSSKAWRDQLTIPRPRMYGVYSATVIGPKGEDIFTDKFCRVKVLFPWDRRKDSTPEHSVWLRVIQPWAGDKWGWQFIPRVGAEVAVAFMDGDVDRPVVVGGLYNGTYMSPFSLTDQKTLSGIETRSTPVPKDANGNPTGKAGYHLLRFDDSYGNEQFLMRSQARMDVTAKASLYETVGVGNRHLTVISGYDKTTNTTVDGSSFVTIGTPHFGIPPYGNLDVHVGGSRFEQVDGTDYGYQLTVKKDMQLDVEENLGGIVKGNLSLNASSIVLEASQKITLKVGSSTIVLNAGGVYLDGTMIYNQCGGPADSAADLTFQNVMDATQADPGEPAKSRQGGGSGGSSPSRGSHQVQAQHAPDTGADDDNMISSDLTQWCEAAGNSE